MAAAARRGWEPMGDLACEQLGGACPLGFAWIRGGAQALPLRDALAVVTFWSSVTFRSSPWRFGRRGHLELRVGLCRQPL